MPPAHELTAPSPRVPALAVPRVAVRYRVAIAVLALAALTFLTPVGADLRPVGVDHLGARDPPPRLSTVDGPSWKPLPVLLTTPFALFGDAAPDLWLFVARAGAHRGVVMAFRVARRLGGVPAGVAAAAAYALAPWMLRNAALGNSEGLLVVLGLAAVDRHLAGRTPPRLPARRSARRCCVPRPGRSSASTGSGCSGATRARARLVAGGARRRSPCCGSLPELWGSGDLLRAAHRAQIPRRTAPAFADDPVARGPAPVRDDAHARAVGRARRARGDVRAAARLARRERRAAVGSLGGAPSRWVAEVAVMTNDGFSGNARYLIMPAAHRLRARRDAASAG